MILRLREVKWLAQVEQKKCQGIMLTRHLTNLTLRSRARKFKFSAIGN